MGRVVLGVRHLDGGFLVFYSMSFRDPGRVPSLVRQFGRSLTTLRATNPDVDVAIVVHGPVPDRVRRTARRHSARLVERPDPVTRLRADLGELGAVIGEFGPVHKFLNFTAVGDAAPTGAAPTTSVYLDADTIVFGDLADLAPADDSPTVMAREEVGSRRCRFGPDVDYLDETALARTVVGAGGRPPAPAFNTGVMLFHRFPWDRARAVERRYLAWLVRFALWMADHPAPVDTPQYGDVFDLDRLRHVVVGPEAGRVRRLAVRYPSVNRWLAEEVAAWVAIGHERDLAVTAFDPRTVAQGGEPLEAPLPTHVWHYFNSNQAGMERRLALAPAR